MNAGLTISRLLERAPRALLLAWIALASLLAPVAALPGQAATRPPRGRVISIDFARGAQGWIGDFADYPAADEALYELEAGMAPLPDGLRGGATGLRLRGTNRSDDLFLFARGPVDGLVPGARYEVRIDLVLASNSPAGAVGVGGAPGEGVAVKAGATGTEPVTLVDRDGFVLLAADKGNQSVGGADATVLGDLAVKTPIDAPRFLLKRFAWRKLPPLVIDADANGRAWIFAGMDSGFEGPTTVYLVRARARFLRVD